MKKIIALLLCISALLLSTGCSKLPIREYSGKEVSSLSFEIIDYMGGYTITYLFDFESNEVKIKEYTPEVENNEEPDFEVFSTFSEEEEKSFINKIYSYGLFYIKDKYPAPEFVCDGGGWNLVIEYKDGTEKRSSGSNNAPDMIFKNCSVAFYDLCGRGVVASPPEEYCYPPIVSISLCMRLDNSIYDYSAAGERLDYKWNGFESIGHDIYEANRSIVGYYEFYDGAENVIRLSTEGYVYDRTKYEKFSTCTVTSYDYNEELTNERIEYRSGWFKNTEIPFEINKIYLVRLDFENGDFVEYTFNTRK